MNRIQRVLNLVSCLSHLLHSQRPAQRGIDETRLRVRVMDRVRVLDQVSA
jgi:hypothetical protein